MDKPEQQISIKCHLNTSVRLNCLSSIDITAPEEAGTDAFITCSDEVARRGMRIFYNPSGDDKQIISGESGAVTLGLVYELLSNKKYRDIKDKLRLKSDSKVLLFSTEGDTDPEHYLEVVCR